MMFKKTVLAFAVVGAATSSYALEETNPFLDDASLDLLFRTVYIMSDTDDKSGKGFVEDNNALVQGVQVAFNSGYINDLVGVDLGMYNGFGIITHDGRAGSDGLLGNGTENNNIVDYAVTAKIKLSDYGTFKYGRNRVQTNLYWDSSNGGSAPELSESAYLDVSFADINAYAYRISRGMDKSEEIKETFEEPVYLIGGNHIFDNDLYLSLDYGQQKNHTEQFYGQAQQPFSVGDGTLTLSGKYQYTGSIGESKGLYYQDSLDIWGAKVAYDYGAASVYASYGKVDGIYQNWDQMIWKGGAGNGSTQVITDEAAWISTDWSDMSSYMIGGSYDLSEYVQGFSIFGSYIEGDSDYESREVTAITVGASYNVPSVENLSFWGMYGRDSDKYTPIDGSKIIDEKYNYVWLQMAYKFSAL